MKKLIILTLISFAVAGLGNMISKSLTTSLSTPSSLSNPSLSTASGWAMFKELFQ